MTNRRKKKATVEVTVTRNSTAPSNPIPNEQQVPTLHQISVIYTANFNATQRQRSNEEDLPPSYESVVVSLPPLPPVSA